MSNPQQSYYYYGQTPNPAATTQWGTAGQAAPAVYGYGGGVNPGAAGTPAEAMYHQQQQYWAAMQQQQAAMYQMQPGMYQYAAAMPGGAAPQAVAPAHGQTPPADAFGEFASAAATHAAGTTSMPSAFSSFGLHASSLAPAAGGGGASSSAAAAASSAFSSLSAMPSAGGSSSATVNSFFSSIMKPATTPTTALAPSSSAALAPTPVPRGPSLNTLASGPASRPAPFSSGSLLEPSSSSSSAGAPPASSTLSSASSFSGEFEAFVSAPKAPATAAPSSSAPLFNPASPVTATPSPPLSSGAPQLQPMTAPAASSFASTTASAAASASDFDRFFSVAPATSAARVATPPSSQQGAGLGHSLLSALPAASVPTPSSPASHTSATGVVGMGLDGDDWSFASAKAVTPTPTAMPAVAAQTSSSNLDAMMHKFSHIEKKTLAGEAAKKSEHNVSQPQPVAQVAATKSQSTRAFNWNDDSYKNIFASIATEPAQPAAVTPAVVEDDDFGDFVSERATSSVGGAGFDVSMPTGHSSAPVGFASNAPAQQLGGQQPSFEAAPGFPAAFPADASSGMSVSDYNMAAYHHMMAMSASMMSYAAQQPYATESALPPPEPAQPIQPAQPAQSAQDDDDDEWTSFASRPTPSSASAGPPVGTITAPDLASFSSLAFGPPLSSSASLSSASGQPLPTASVPSIPMSAPSAFPPSPFSASNGAQGGDIPLLPSPRMESDGTRKTSPRGRSSSSSKFGSFDQHSGSVEKPARPGQADWHEQAMRQTLVHLQQGAVIFQQLVEVTNSALLSSTLRSEKVDAYLLGLCEVYKIGRRVGKNWRSDMAKELGAEIDTAWMVFKEVIDGLNFKPLSDLHRWQEQQEKSDKQAWSGRSACPLCFAPVTPLDVQLTLQNSLYHAPCANFYSSLRQIPSS